MEQLPPELIDQISSYLPPESLTNTLLLSRAFCSSAEKYSGWYERFALNEDTAAKFIPIFSGRRLSYLRNLEFEVCLPLPKDSEHRDDANQLSKHDESFTNQITFLFRTLRMVEQRARDEYVSGRVRLAISSPMRPISCERSLSYHDHFSWRVHLLDPEALPLLSSVRSLEVGDDWGGSFRKALNQEDCRLARLQLDYRVMIDLVAKLPNLEY